MSDWQCAIVVTLIILAGWAISPWVADKMDLFISYMARRYAWWDRWIVGNEWKRLADEWKATERRSNRGEGNDDD